MIALISGRLWQLAAAAAGGLALVCLGLWLAGQSERHSLRAERDRLRTSIEAPLTGWSARLDQCRANVKTLDETLQVQNAAVDANARDAAGRIAAAEARLRRAEADHARTRRRMADLDQPLRDATPCGRMTEADQRFQELLR